MKLEWTNRRRRAAMITAWIAATALLAICARNVDLSRAGQVLASVRLSWAAAAIVANGAILLLWAGFWGALRPPEERSISFTRMFEITSTASALMNTVPFGGGHAASVLLLIRRGETTQRGALSVLALDQLGEGLAKVSIFLLVGWLLPLPAWMRAGITTASLAVAAWLVTLVVASRWATELRILERWRGLKAMAYVGAMKAAEACAIAAVQHAFGVDISVSGTLLVLAAVILGSMIPMSPGNLGTYEASAFLAYRYLGITPEQAMGLALVQHICFIVPSVGVGYLMMSVQTVSRSAIASR